MNIVYRFGISFLLFAGIMLAAANIACACSPEDGCTECEAGMVAACFKAEADRDALDVSMGKYTRKSSLVQNYSGSADATADCAECRGDGEDSATKKGFCPSYLASGICNR
jgi:hypothetical protein